MKPRKVLTATMIAGVAAGLAGGIGLMPPSAGEAQEAQATGPENRSSVYRIYVDGMACPMCAFSIKRRLEEIDGVRQVDVDLAQSVFAVTVDVEMELDRERVRAVVQDAGFTFRAMERSQTSAE